MDQQTLIQIFLCRQALVHAGGHRKRPANTQCPLANIRGFGANVFKFGQYASSCFVFGHQADL